MRILYLKSSRRWPIRTATRLFAGDLQGAIPLAWCRECGKEVFTPDREICPECEKGGAK